MTANSEAANYAERDILRELYLQRHRRWKENLRDRPTPNTFQPTETKASMKKRLLESL